MHEPNAAPRDLTASNDSGCSPALRLHRLAEQTRQAAGRLRSTLETDWESLAAQRFRAQLAAEAVAVQAVAERLDEAARNLAAP